MKTAFLVSFTCFCLIINPLYSQWNLSGPHVYTLPVGNVGVGTTFPTSVLHISSLSNTYLTINKPNSSNEGGILFTNGNSPLFYLFSDNDGTNDLRIEAYGLPGETDITP